MSVTSFGVAALAGLTGVGVGYVLVNRWAHGRSGKPRVKVVVPDEEEDTPTRPSCSESYFFRDEETSGMIPELHEYVVRVATRETPQQRQLRRQTAAMGSIRVMQISPDEGAVLTTLSKLLGASRVVEVGCFTGYSALCFALAVPSYEDGGQVITIDITDEYLPIARRQWDASGVGDRIDFRQGPALEILPALRDEEARAGRHQAFDVAFLDAVKTEYDAYYEECMELVRPGGIIFVDNTLWHGKVADPSHHDADTDAIRAFNEKLRNDTRVDICLLPVGDGLTLARKRI